MWYVIGAETPVRLQQRALYRLVRLRVKRRGFCSIKDWTHVQDADVIPVLQMSEGSWVSLSRTLQVPRWRTIDMPPITEYRTVIYIGALKNDPEILQHLDLMEAQEWVKAVRREYKSVVHGWSIETRIVSTWTSLVTVDRTAK